MAEYIEREAAEKILYDGCHTSNGRECPDDVVELWHMVQAIPAADVAPFRHGKWMTTSAFPHHVFCSECKRTYIPNDRWQVWQDEYGDGGLPRAYCPNCGAKMDGEA